MVPVRLKFSYLFQTETFPNRMERLVGTQQAATGLTRLIPAALARGSPRTMRHWIEGSAHTPAMAIERVVVATLEAA